MKKYKLKKKYKKALIVFFGIVIVVTLTLIYTWRIEQIENNPKNTSRSIILIKK